MVSSSLIASTVFAPCAICVDSVYNANHIQVQQRRCAIRRGRSQMEILDRRQAMVIAAQHHFDADMLIKGSYGEGDGTEFKGCSVGCFAHEIGGKFSSIGIHKKVADFYGYPEWLALLQDAIFEGLPNGPQGENSKWHVQLAGALAKLPPDYDWGFALHRVHVAILRISYQTAGSSAAFQEIRDGILSAIAEPAMRELAAS